jgi:hypothetical protein
MTRKKRFPKTAAAALVLAAVFVLAGCGEFVIGSNIAALDELTGRWYDRDYDFAFEITPAGEGYIASTKTQCDVSVLGSLVYFKDSRGNPLGSFSYSLKNGPLTMTSGTGDFRGIRSSSPFVKAGTVPSGAEVPLEFIGRWYSTTTSSSSSHFEITPAGGMIIPGFATPYTVRVQGNHVSVLDGIVLQGEFQCSFRYYGEMIVTNGTDLCAGLAILSPFVKSR